MSARVNINKQHSQDNEHYQKGRATGAEGNLTTKISDTPSHVSIDKRERMRKIE